MLCIKKLVIPDTVRYLGVTAVNGNVVSYMDPNGTTGTFEGMTDLVHVLLPKNDNFIGIPNYTFAGCNKIEAIRIPASVKYIGKNAFGYSSLAHICRRNTISIKRYYDLWKSRYISS